VHGTIIAAVPPSIVNRATPPRLAALLAAERPPIGNQVEITPRSQPSQNAGSE
jgi:hypothetical protein